MNTCKEFNIELCHRCEKLKDNDCLLDVWTRHIRLNMYSGSDIMFINTIIDRYFTSDYNKSHYINYIYWISEAIKIVRPSCQTKFDTAMMLL